MEIILGTGAIAFSEVFTGTGAQTAFTMAQVVSQPWDIIVSENGIVQRPTTDYTVSGTTLTFTTAPVSGIIISVRRVGGATGATGATGSGAQVKGFSGFCGGIPGGNDVVSATVSPYAWTIASANSVAKATVAATASNVFTFRNNGVTVGTFTFAAAATVSSVLSITGPTSVVVGDFLTITNQTTGDTTLANISFLVRE